MTNEQYYWNVYRQQLLRNAVAVGAMSHPTPVPPTPSGKMHDYFSMADDTGTSIEIMQKNAETSTEQVAVFDAYTETFTGKLKFTYLTSKWTLEDSNGTEIAFYNHDKGSELLEMSNGYKLYGWTQDGQWTITWSNSDLIGDISRSRNVLPQSYYGGIPMSWMINPDNMKIPQITHIVNNSGDFVNDIWKLAFDDNTEEFTHYAVPMEFDAVQGKYVVKTLYPYTKQLELRLNDSSSRSTYSRNGELIATAVWSENT